MNIQQAKEIPIIDYLNSLGFKPQKIRGTDYWYLSPFRNEKTASFKVNNAKNLFYDFGIGQGGTIIDFGVKYHSCTVSEFLSKLESFFSFPQQKSNTSDFQNSTHASLNEKNTIEKRENIFIHSIKNIGNNVAISNYIRSRKIDLSVAEKFVKEIYYTINGKHFFRAGFLNDSGGYEVRNKYFKGCIGKKDISHLKHDQSELYLFEGVFDFLSWSQLNCCSKQKTDVIVLNSIPLLGSVEHVIPEYKTVHFYFDNDEAGIDAGIQLQKLRPSAIDHRMEYIFFKDLNDHLKSNNGEEITWII